MYNTYPPVFPHSPVMAPTQIGYVSQKAASPGAFLPEPGNPKARATGPRDIHLTWDPPPGNPTGYKVQLSAY